MPIPIERFAPKYVQVASTIADRIDQGVYVQGMLLPSEANLAHEFLVTSPTVRSALGLLREYGYVRTTHGVGSRVARRPPVQ